MSIFYPAVNIEPTICSKNLYTHDPSLNHTCTPSTEHEFFMSPSDISYCLFKQYDIDYLNTYFHKNHIHYRILSHPQKTNTCYEKAIIIGQWNPLNVIKTLYFQDSNGFLYAVVIPETGCFFKNENLINALELVPSCELAKAKNLPQFMTYGTCSPFVTKNDCYENGGRVKKIIFDSETLNYKKKESTLDDFSFGTDHRFSLQMNYYECYKLLQYQFGTSVMQAGLLTLSFKESFIRTKGKLNINYDFSSINYRTALFINSIHGFGDVTIKNDFSSELNLPNILKSH